MTREDIDNIINIVCPNDEDFEKPIISPAYLKKELEALALEQEPILEKIRAEIGKSKTEHEMQLAENDTKGKLLISDIYCDIVNILDKYKAEVRIRNDL